ncbi:glycosyltransferase [candidate division WS5 bacterium]|uniref:Glycosyltransferase n=1 Tax=candidate division WS5 bacterium TaxID=2093353 RepID=A0A419DBV0_9BACT|nr:MAG: glycosyltransferase [candidate division WS5 bacterium]
MTKILTEKYLKRPVDKRMVKIIDEHFPKSEVILDLGCGSGLYGKYLSLKSKKVIGLDNDKDLCKKAKSTQYYDNVVCEDVLDLEKLLSNVDGIFCSELLEHIDNNSLIPVLKKMEVVCGVNGKIIITVPNPLSPHFKLDFSHVLKYNIFSFLRILNRSDYFQYKMYPIGFSEYNLKLRKYRVLNLLSKRAAILSPTVLYVGERLKDGRQTSPEKNLSLDGQKKESILVSVVVPTLNSSTTISKCLESIKKQTYKNIEIIVVDHEKSVDDTTQIAKEYTNKVFIKGIERCIQRNFGGEKAKGEYILFIDSDMELSENVVKSCVEKMTGKTKGIIIPEESFGEGFWARCKNLERSFYVGVDWMEGARFFRRKEFLKVGGYNEELISGEDWDLSQKIEALGRLDRVESVIYHNEGKISLLRTIRKKFYYSSHFDNYIKTNTNKEKSKKQTNLFLRYKLYFSKPKKLLRNPVLGFGMIFMKTCEFSFGGAGFMLKRLNLRK